MFTPAPLTATCGATSIHFEHYYHDRTIAGGSVFQRRWCDGRIPPERTTDPMMVAARSLASSHDEPNPEYDRALVELTATVLNLPYADVPEGVTAYVLGEVDPEQVLADLGLTIDPPSTVRCGCDIPNRADWRVVVKVTKRHTSPPQQQTVTIWQCAEHHHVRHAGDVKALLRFDGADEWDVSHWYMEPTRYPLTSPTSAPTCSECGSTLVGEDCPDYGFGPIHSPITEAAAQPIEPDLRLRSESEEEDTILRHFRGSLHNGAECRACKAVQFERRIGDRRVAECHAERDTLTAHLAERDAKITDLRITLNSIIEG